jgi:hypothetical protein
MVSFTWKGWQGTKMTTNARKIILINMGVHLRLMRISPRLRFYARYGCIAGRCRISGFEKAELGFKFLIYFARGISASGTVEKGETPMLVDCLPDSLEYLCIRGYEKGENEEFDRQVDALMAHYESGLSNLKEIKGIMETIPNSENVDNPDGDYDLLWSLEEAGYESD